MAKLFLSKGEQEHLPIAVLCTNLCHVELQVLTRAVQAWDGQEKTIVSTTTAGPDGEFCFLLPVGDYVVKVTNIHMPIVLFNNKSMCFVMYKYCG